MFRNLKDIHNFLNSRALHSFWVVQKYIEKPLLYNGRKFDIRVWAVVTHKNEVFMYKKAYIRTSSDSYDLNNKNNYVHLTNNCLQQNGQNYGKHEDGNTLPLEILDEYFAAAYPEKNVKLETHIMPRIKDLTPKDGKKIFNETNVFLNSLKMSKKPFKKLEMTFPSLKYERFFFGYFFPEFSTSLGKR